MTNTEYKINALFGELVPSCGKAETIAGEIIRAVSRIAYRYYNDGDHIGVGYGNVTCNSAARFLIEEAGSEIAEAVLNIWGLEDENPYNKGLSIVLEKVLEYIEQNPELKTWENNKDIYDYYDPGEDVEYEEEEEWE